MLDMLISGLGSAASQFFGGGGKSAPAAASPQAADAGTSGINSVFSGLGESVSKGISGGVGQRVQNLVAGLPQPGDFKAQGRARNDYNNSAFPGTSTWEQLGGAGGSGSSPAQAPQQAAQFAHEAKQQKRQLKTQERIVDKQTGAQLQAAAMQSGHAIPPAASPAYTDQLRNMSQRDLNKQKLQESIANVEQLRRLGKYTEAQTAHEGVKIEALQLIVDQRQELAPYFPELAKFQTNEAAYKWFAPLVNGMESQWNSDNPSFVVKFLKNLSPDPLSALVDGFSMLATGGMLGRAGVKFINWVNSSRKLKQADRAANTGKRTQRSGYHGDKSFHEHKTETPIPPPPPSNPRQSTLSRW